MYINIKEFFNDKNFKVFAYFENEYINNELSGYNNLPKFLSEKIEDKIENIKSGCSIDCNTTWGVKSSSFGTWKNYTYKVAQLNDNLINTAWVEGVPGHGINETITFYNFKSKENTPVVLNGFLLYNGYIKSKDLFLKNSRVRSFVLYKNENPLYFLQLIDIMDAQKVSFPDIILNESDKITLKIIDIYGGIKYQDTAITLLLPYKGK